MSHELPILIAVTALVLAAVLVAIGTIGPLE